MDQRKYLEIYAQIEAVKAEIEGMRAENQFNKELGYRPLYLEGAFKRKAEELRNLGAEALKY